MAVPAFLLFFMFSPSVIQLFMSKGGEAAAQVGVEFLRIVSPFLYGHIIKAHSGWCSQRFRQYESVYGLHVHGSDTQGFSGICTFWFPFRCCWYLDVPACRMGNRQNLCFILQVCGKRKAGSCDLLKIHRSLISHRQKSGIFLSN